MTISSPEKISTDSAPVISDCATRLSVPKKKVKPTVTSAPTNSTSQTMSGTVPEAATIRASRAWVSWSSW